MLSGHFFKRISAPQPVSAEQLRPNGGELIEILLESVIDRFARMSGTGLHAAAMVLPQAQETEDPPPGPAHSACAEHVSSDYCRESWQLHLAELKDKPETHWHKCDYGRLCALVPVVCRGQCLAVIKLACASEITEEDFERRVETLDLLVRDLVVRQGDVLANLVSRRPAVGEPGETRPSTEPRARECPNHPQVVKALAYIESHLSDPGLTVGRVARELDLHPSYLGQLFGDHVGEKMSRLITARRIELAKTLLRTTDWQVKRIAAETGHANPNWFCHVFSIHTGFPPGEYRRRVSEGP